MSHSLFEPDPESAKALASLLDAAPPVPKVTGAPWLEAQAGVSGHHGTMQVDVRRRRRISKRHILGLVLVLIAVAFYFRWQSDSRAHIIVYNKTNKTLPLMCVSVAGQSRMIPSLEPEDSLLWVLRAQGDPGPVSIDVAEAEDQPAWTWHGDLVEPNSGHQIVLRIQGDGSVEDSDTVAPWRQWMSGNPDVKAELPK